MLKYLEKSHTKKIHMIYNFKIIEKLIELFFKIDVKFEGKVWDVK